MADRTPAEVIWDAVPNGGPLEDDMQPWLSTRILAALSAAGYTIVAGEDQALVHRVARVLNHWVADGGGTGVTIAAEVPAREILAIVAGEGAGGASPTDREEGERVLWHNGPEGWAPTGAGEVTVRADDLRRVLDAFKATLFNGVHVNPSDERARLRAALADGGSAPLGRDAT